MDSQGIRERLAEVFPVIPGPTSLEALVGRGHHLTPGDQSRLKIAFVDKTWLDLQEDDLRRTATLLPHLIDEVFWWYFPGLVYLAVVDALSGRTDGWLLEEVLRETLATSKEDTSADSRRSRIGSRQFYARLSDVQQSAMNDLLDSVERNLPNNKDYESLRKIVIEARAAIG